jgi:sigma-B regulation protein RsbU (phosphoserine phosphatase)
MSDVKEPREVRLSIPAALDDIPAARQALREFLGRFGLEDTEVMKLELALHEVCVNVVLYAYKGRQQGVIGLRFWEDNGRLGIEIRDKGVPFDPAGMPPPDFVERIRLGQKNGLGVYLYKVLADAYAYRREKGENVLTLFKDLGRSGA